MEVYFHFRAALRGIDRWRLGEEKKEIKTCLQQTCWRFICSQGVYQAKSGLSGGKKDSVEPLYLCLAELLKQLQLYVEISDVICIFFQH